MQNNNQFEPLLVGIMGIIQADIACTPLYKSLNLIYIGNFKKLFIKRKSLFKVVGQLQVSVF